MLTVGRFKKTTRCTKCPFITMPPPPSGALTDGAVWRLSDVCLSVAYIGNNSRTERPRKTKIGTQIAHVTRDSDTTFKVKGQLAGAWEYCGGMAYVVNIH